jgi:hypothetical protein
VANEKSRVPFSFPWQWVFPATSHYTDRINGDKWRHHFHESVLQRAFKMARLKAGVARPASCHTLWHAPQPAKLPQRIRVKSKRMTRQCLDNVNDNLERPSRGGAGTETAQRVHLGLEHIRRCFHSDPERRRDRNGFHKVTAAGDDRLQNRDNAHSGKMKR